MNNYTLIFFTVALSLIYSAAFAFFMLKILKGTILEVANYQDKWVINSSGLIMMAFLIAYVSASSYFQINKMLNKWVVVFTVVSISIMVIGFIDDLFGDDTRGLKGHLRQASKGKITTGLIKAIVGSILAVIAAYFFSKTYIDLVVNALMIALFINFFNLVDLRPARALKTSLFVGLWPFIFSTTQKSKIMWTWLIPFIGPFIILFYLDLTQRAMLGDSGSNFIGASFGLIFAYQFNWYVNLPVLLILIGLQYYAEKGSFSEVIEKNSLLKWLDKLGNSPADLC